MPKFLFLTFGKFQRSLFTLLVAFSFVINESKCSEQKRRHFRQDLKTKISQPFHGLARHCTAAIRRILRQPATLCWRTRAPSIAGIRRSLLAQWGAVLPQTAALSVLPVCAAD